MGEIVTLDVRLLCGGRPDFDVIEKHRGDGVLAQLLGLSGVSAVSTRRARQTKD